jgi:4-hydroxy-tetrahydrodipicolinate synthase
VISITPFDADGNIDWNALRAQFGRFRAAGIGVYVGGGGSGEGFTLTPEEVDRLLEVAMEELAGSVPVRAMGVEPRTAGQMLDFARQVERHGVPAMQIYSLDMGHLGQPKPEELEAYFVEVLDGVTTKTVLSTHFSVGYMVPVDLLASLCHRYGSVIGVNCSISADLPYLVRLLDELPPHIEVHVGGPHHAMSAMAMGATGFLSSEANLAPQLAQHLVDRYGAGDYEAAHEAYAKIMVLFSLGASGPGGKPLFNSLGLPGGYPRRPRLSLSAPETIRATQQRLARVGIPELDDALAAALRD